MVSRGTDASRAFWNIVRSVGLLSGSPPPSRAATSTWRISLAKSLPLALSAAPFLCLMVAHLEWPDMLVSSYDGSGEPRWRRRTGLLVRVANGFTGPPSRAPLPRRRPARPARAGTARGAGGRRRAQDGRRRRGPVPAGTRRA